MPSEETKTIRPHKIIERYHSNSVDSAAAFLNRLYGADCRWEGSSRSLEGFAFEMVSARLGDTRLTRATLSQYHLSRTLSDSVQIVLPVKGGLAARSRGLQTLASDADSAAVVTRPGERTSYSVSDGVGIILLLPVRDLVSRAELLTDKAFHPGLLDTALGKIDLKEPSAAMLSRHMRTTFSEMQALDAAGMGRFGQGGYEDLLLNMAAGALLPAVTREIQAPAADCGPAAIRKARDFIYAHAAEPIEIAKIAGLLGISMRSLQENFRKQYGHSPRDWVLECRLENVRQGLQSKVKDGSVTEVALAAGFTDLGSFAAKYRERYGELPSQTLRLARAK